MASPGAYASPLRENQVGLFGDGATHPPTPPTNVRVLIAQKEKELVALSEQRLSQLNARASDLEERLQVKETELARTRAQFQQLTADFRYNLKLLEDRDAELERLDASVVTYRAATEKAEHALAAARSAIDERDAELRRQKARVGELEAYHAEKVERLQKQTDEARYARDDQLQRQKNDFANLERQLVRQVEEQKAAIETERRETLEKLERERVASRAEIEVPINTLRRELSDEKAQTLAVAAELEAWRVREENTRNELAKSETARRAAEANAVAVYEKLAEMEATVGELRSEVAELRAVKDLAPEKTNAEVERAVRDAEMGARAQREEDLARREREAERLRARITTLEDAIASDVRKQRDASEERDERRSARRDGTSPSVSKSASKSSGKKKNVAMRDDDAHSGSSETEESVSRSESKSKPKSKSKSKSKSKPKSESESESESETPPRSPPRRSRRDREIFAPPSIGKEKPEAPVASDVGAAAIAATERTTRVSAFRRRGDAPDSRTVSSSRIEKLWSSLPPRAPVVAPSISRADIERAARLAVNAALAQHEAPGGGAAKASANAAKASANAGAGAAASEGVEDETGSESTGVDPEIVSPRARLANAKRAVEVSSGAAARRSGVHVKIGAKKKKTKPHPSARITTTTSSSVHGTFGRKQRAPSSLAASEVREARLLADLESKIAALSSGRIKSGRSIIKGKALR